MSRHRILELGAGPADEPCAQLGQCADFAEANTLELLAYKAAIIALIANAHDFGTYRTLWLVSVELPLPEDAQGWLDDLVEPATWIAAGFPQPVTYEGARAVMRPFRDVVAAALQITRANADGRFFPADNAVLHRNLLAAYGPATSAAADSG